MPGVTRRRDRLRDLSRALPRASSLTDTQRQKLDHLDDRLPKALLSGVQRRRIRLSEAVGSLRPTLLSRDISNESCRLNALSERMEPAFRRKIEKVKERALVLDQRRQAMGYEATLKRGYAVVHSAEGVVTTKPQAEAAQELEIEFQDGRVKLGGSTPRKALIKPTPPDQGSLF